MTNKKKHGLGKTSNPVAKFAKRFNKSAVMVDRKKEERRTGGRWNLDDDFYDSASTVVSNVIGMYEDGYTTIQIATELKLPIITVENIVSCIWDYEDFN